MSSYWINDLDDCIRECVNQLDLSSDTKIWFTARAVSSAGESLPQVLKVLSRAKLLPSNVSQEALVASQKIKRIYSQLTQLDYKLISLAYGPLSRTRTLAPVFVDELALEGLRDVLNLRFKGESGTMAEEIVDELDLLLEKARFFNSDADTQNIEFNNIVDDIIAEIIVNSETRD